MYDPVIGYAAYWERISEKEYKTLLNELDKFNPELLDKGRILAISKSDLLDDELMHEMKTLIPKELPVIFISSVTGMNIDQLKDLLWKEMNRTNL